MSRARALIRIAVPVAAIGLLLALRACLVTAPRDQLAPAGAGAQQGSLLIARGGPVIVGFITEGTAKLTVDGHELAGHGLVKQRLILPAGPVAIRVEGDATLLWSPVGRRGDPEYISASSLSPDPPATAHFDHPGTALVDGGIALALLLVIAGTLVYLARGRLRAVPRPMWVAIGAVAALACIARWIDLGGFGQTWDEDVNWAAGRDYVTNLLSLDFRREMWSWNFEHPPVMKYLAGIGAQLADGFGPARALSAVWTALGCALLVPIGARLYSLRTGVIAAVIAALLPSLVAHGQIVGHESPTVLWWSLGILLALGVHDVPERVRVRLAWVGVVCGIAIASRFVNALLGPLCFAIVVIQAPADRRKQTAIDAAVVLAAAAALTLYVVWPRLWLHPIGAVQESLAKLTKPHSPEPYLGTITAAPGLSYFPLYLVATLPVAILAAAIAGTVRAARTRDRSALIVLLWLVIPLGVAASPVRQDGVRYVLPCVLALAMLAGLGLDALAGRVRWRRAPHAVVAAIAVYLAVTLVRIHPYYLDYFGEQVGGPGTVAAHGWFETAWWGEGVDRAVDYVNAHAAPGAHVYRDCIEPVHLAWFREDLWTPMVTSPMQATWIVTYAPETHHCPVPRDARRVFAVDASGVTLAEVWQRP